MREYFLSVICAAILCAIVSGLTEKKGTSASVLRLISGVFLSFTVIRPITTVKLEDMSFFTSQITQEAAYVSNMGQEHTQSAMAAIIKQEIESYILDKAATLDGNISAQVSLDEEMLPKSVILSGQLSSYGKNQLTQIIETDLGIAKENQIWSES